MMRNVLWSFAAPVAAMVLFCGCGGEAGGDPAEATDEDASQLTGNARVVYVGDSIAYETRSIIQNDLEATGRVGFASSTKGGMAICDFFPETEAPVGSGTLRTYPPAAANLSELVAFMKPHVVAMQFWGNSWGFTPCMKDANGNILQPGTPAYYDRYRKDANHAMELIAAAAAKAGAPMPAVLWTLQGPDAGSATRTRELNAIYASLSQTWPTATTVDAGFTVSMAANYWNPGDRYTWSRFLPCTQLERTTGHCIDAYGGVARIHSDQDSLHFCLGTTTSGACDVWSPGVYRYGLAISTEIKKALGL